MCISFYLFGARDGPRWRPSRRSRWTTRGSLHAAKGGAVETGCSDSYDVIY